MHSPDRRPVVFILVIGNDDAAADTFGDAANLGVIVVDAIALVTKSGVAGDLVITGNASVFVVGLRIRVAVNRVQLLDKADNQPGKNRTR